MAFNPNLAKIIQEDFYFAARTKRTKTGTSKSSNSSNSSSISTSEIRQIVEKLKGQRVRGTTRKNYYSVWKSFNDFFILLDEKPQFWEERLTLFIAYLIEYKKLQSQTVRSYISAIRSVLLEDGYEIDEDRFLLSSLTKACKFTNDQVRTRLPIQKPLLLEILKFTGRYFLEQGQPYLAVLYQTIFCSAYYGLLRVSEVTLTPGNHAVRVTDVHLGVNKSNILFILRSSKTHGRYTHPQLIKITSEGLGKEKKSTGPLSPFNLIKKYSKMRPDYRNKAEPFFIFRDFSPVTGLHMRSTLHLMLKLMNYNEILYNCHSFRAGRSLDLMKYGVPVELIKKLGRWKSNAVYTYLRSFA